MSSLSSHTANGVSPLVPSSTAPAPSREMLAFERVRPGLQALIASNGLAPIRLDIPNIVVATLKALPILRPMREAMLALPGMDIRSLDQLEETAHALVWANVQYQMATRSPERLVAAYDRAVELRALLQPPVDVLVKRGLIDGRELDDYQGTKGYKVVAGDLALLAGVIRKGWEGLRQKTPITAEEVEEASRLGLEILAMVAERGGSPAAVAEATQMRAAAYSLLLNRHAEVRAAVQFIRRREGDADTLVPSLFAGRVQKGAARDAPAEDAEPVEHVAASSVTSEQRPATVAGTAYRPEDDPFES